jgi:hypothetical protein
MSKISEFPWKPYDLRGLNPNDYNMGFQLSKGNLNLEIYMYVDYDASIPPSRLEAYDHFDFSIFNTETGKYISCEEIDNQVTMCFGNSKGIEIVEDDEENYGILYAVGYSMAYKLCEFFAKPTQVVMNGGVCAKCKQFDAYAMPTAKYNNEIRCYRHCE